jgi:Aromatic acid exporter family member 1
VAGPRDRVRSARDAVLTRARTSAGGLVRRGRPPGLRTAKTVLAAVIAYALADALHTSSSPVLAPLTALLVVQLTMYETLAHGRERVVSVVAGVLVAVVFASFVGLTWWSLGLVVAVSLVAGRLLRLGPQLLEVPITAMLVLAVGGAERYALGRVAETLLGAAVGIVVNLVIAPPLYIQPASDAIAELADRMAAFAADLAGALREGWSRSVAEAQLNRARRLGEDVARADRHLARTEESARLNPRGGQARSVEPRLRSSLTALEHAQVGLRNLTRALLDRTFFVPEDEAARAWSPGAREALAAVLEATGEALRDTAGVPRAVDRTPSPEEVEDLVAALDRARGRLAAELVVDPAADAAAWAQHGSLLDAVDRLRVEIRSALTPPGPVVRGPRTARPRRAVGRAVGRAVTSARRRRPPGRGRPGPPG